MTRDRLEHVLRASAAITTDKSFVVVGSQSVLLPYPNAPTELLLSNEVDLYPALHPERSDLIEGAIGQLSMFHDTFGYYAARLESRLRALDAASGPIETWVAWARRRHEEARA